MLAGSIAGDCLGEMVASEKITLGDYGGRGPDGRSQFAIHVDDEGTPCEEVAIIEKGVLKNYLVLRCLVWVKALFIGRAGSVHPFV